MAKEPLFAVNSFNEPSMITDTVKTDTQMLYYALMGTDMPRLTEGVVYAIRKYQFKDIKESASQIEATLRDFCMIHIPGLIIQDLNVQASSDTKLLIILSVAADYEAPQSNIIFSVEQKNTRMLVDIINQ